MHSLNQRRSWILLYGFQTVLVWFFWFKSFSDEILMDSYGLQPFLHVVNHRILLRFWKILGFHTFLNQTRLKLTDLCWFKFVNVLDYEEVSFWFSPVFYSEIWIRIFRTLWFDSVFAGSCLKSGNKPVILLLLLHWFKTFAILPLFFSNSSLWSRLNLLPLVVNSRLNCREKAQWWRFNHESLRANENSIDSAWICF